MLKTHTLLFVAVISVVTLASNAEAQTIIMDATTNNGSFIGASNGPWSDPGVIPTGWDGTPLTGALGYTVAQAAMHYVSFEAFYNTGVAVTDNTVYTITGNGNSFAGETVHLAVIATENADGSGATVLLADALFTDGNQTAPNYSSASAPALLPFTPGVSLTTDSAVDGYYVQVRSYVNQDVPSAYYWFDDVVVTATEVPEPGALGLLMLGSALVFCRRHKVS